MYCRDQTQVNRMQGKHFIHYTIALATVYLCFIYLVLHKNFSCKMIHTQKVYEVLLKPAWGTMQAGCSSGDVTKSFSVKLLSGRSFKTGSTTSPLSLSFFMDTFSLVPAPCC